MSKKEVIYHSEIVMSNGRSKQELIEEAKVQGLARIKKMKEEWDSKPVVIGKKMCNNTMIYRHLPPPDWRVRTTITPKGHCRLEIVRHV